MDQSERLARIEQKIEHIIDVLEDTFKNQQKHNDIFSGVRDKVIVMESSAKGAWWVVGVLGSLTVVVSGFVAWVVVQIRS